MKSEIQISSRYGSQKSDPELLPTSWLCYNVTTASQGLKHNMQYITLILYVHIYEDIYSMGMIHESNHKFLCKHLEVVIKVIRSINYFTVAM